MSKTRYVIPVDHLPARPPIVFTAVAFMALDLYDAPGVAWGVLGTVIALAWIGWAILVARQESKKMPGYGTGE
jgi:hypothetical protein